MTALCSGRNRAGRGNASPVTGRVRAAFAVLRGELHRAPTAAEVHARLHAEGLRLRPEAVAVHLRLAGLRAGEGAAS